MKTVKHWVFSYSKILFGLQTLLLLLFTSCATYGEQSGKELKSIHYVDKEIVEQVKNSYNNLQEYLKNNQKEILTLMGTQIRDLKRFNQTIENNQSIFHK